MRPPTWLTRPSIRSPLTQSRRTVNFCTGRRRIRLLVLHHACPQKTRPSPPDLAPAEHQGPGMQRQKKVQPMSSQTEWDVRNSLSNQPRIVWSKRSLATQCANPQCSQELLYLREGRVALLDLESHANDQPRPDDGAFAMRSLASRFFWLCGECTKTYVVKRWTTSGLVVVLRNRADDSNPHLADRLHRRKHRAASAGLAGRPTSHEASDAICTLPQSRVTALACMPPLPPRPAKSLMPS